MDTEIAYTQDGKQFNRFHQEVIDCKTACGRKTTMTGTRLCDFCWEADRVELGSPKVDVLPGLRPGASSLGAWFY